MNRTTVEIQHTKKKDVFHAHCVLAQTKFVFTFQYFSEESLTTLLQIFEKDYAMKYVNDELVRRWSFQVRLNNLFGGDKVFIRLFEESQDFCVTSA